MKFNSTQSSSNGLLDIIKTLRSDIIGCEVGVWEAENLCQLLEHCPNISKMYAIDQYKPYQDWNRFIDDNEILNVKLKAKNNLESIEQYNRVEFLELSSNDAVNYIPDNSLDFIFI